MIKYVNRYFRIHFKEKKDPLTALEDMFLNVDDQVMKTYECYYNMVMVKEEFKGYTYTVPKDTASNFRCQLISEYETESDLKKAGYGTQLCEQLCHARDSVECPLEEDD